MFSILPWFVPHSAGVISFFLYVIIPFLGSWSRDDEQLRKID